MTTVLKVLVVPFIGIKNIIKFIHFCESSGKDKLDGILMWGLAPPLAQKAIRAYMCIRGW